MTLLTHHRCAGRVLSIPVGQATRACPTGNASPEGGPALVARSTGTASPEGGPALVACPTGTASP
eukprot:287379-Chlamydomonas_euryale.AAC.2